MDLLRRFVSLIRNLLRGRQMERELDAELRGYVDLLTDEKIAAGMSPDQARREARIALGGIDQVKEEVRQVRAGTLPERIARDLRYSLRTLRRSPGFAVVTILTLAIGVGANTVVLSALRQLLWNPIEARQAEDLVSIRTTSSRSLFQTLTEQATTLQSVAAFQTLRVTAGVDGRPAAALAMFASDNYFDVAGVQPLIGRIPHGTHGPSAEPAALLGHAFWRTRFGGRDVIGSTVTVNGVPVTVAGILPRGYRGTRLAASPDLYLSLDDVVTTKVFSARSPNARWLQLLGRRQPGATVDAISAEVTALWRASQPGAVGGSPLVVRPAIETSIDRAAVRRTLGAGAVAAVLLLLIGAVNIGSLASARATARRPEIGLRVAIGASRGALVQQFATESVLLALGGLSAGLVLAVWVSSALTSVQLTRGVPLVFDASPDSIAILIAAAVAMLTGLCCTLLPMLGVLRVDLASVLKSDSGRQVTAVATPLRNALVVMQLGAALGLAICGVLLLQTVREQQSIGLGFDQRHVLLVDPRPHGQLGEAGLRSLHERIARGLSELPGVRQVSRTHLPPLTPVAFEDSMRIGSAPEVDVYYNEVDPANFATLGIPLRGATFSRPGAAAEAVVDESFARRYWPGTDALGQTLQLGSEKGPRTVVGVVRDSKYRSLTDVHTPILYLPIPERPPSTALFLVRVDGDAERRLEAVRAAMQQLAPGFAVDVRTMSQHLREYLAQPRAVATLVGVLSAIACVLTMVGLFGLLMYLASRRRREIAIRIALGASPRAARATLMRRGLGLAAAGATTGLVLAGLGARLLAGSLYGVQPFEPAIYAGAAAGLLALAAIASYIPAWQASRVDPLEVLRHE